MRGIRYASVMAVGLLVAPVALHAQNVKGNSSQMCAMMAGMLKNMKIGNGQIVLTPTPAPAAKASGADSAGTPSGGSMDMGSMPMGGSSGSSAPADSAKGGSAGAKPAAGNGVTCNFSAAAAPDSTAPKPVIATDSASLGKVADTTKAAGANKP